MNTRIPIASVKQSVVVEAPIERAFKVFTEDFGSFKPREHNMLGVSIAATVFEPRVGGHIYDRGVDGSECRWTRVLAYEPPDRVLLSWDISPRWQVETDPDRTSEWEVRFIAETANRTRVELEQFQEKCVAVFRSELRKNKYLERVGDSTKSRTALEHRNLERHGLGWEGVRDGVAGDRGWPLYLQRYAGLFGR